MLFRPSCASSIRRRSERHVRSGLQFGVILLAVAVGSSAAARAVTSARIVSGLVPPNPTPASTSRAVSAARAARSRSRSRDRVEPVFAQALAAAGCSVLRRPHFSLPQQARIRVFGRASDPAAVATLPLLNAAIRSLTLPAASAIQGPRLFFRPGCAFSIRRRYERQCSKRARFGVVLLAVTVGSMAAARAEEVRGKSASPLQVARHQGLLSIHRARWSRAARCRWGRPRWSGR